MYVALCATNYANAPLSGQITTPTLSVYYDATKLGRAVDDNGQDNGPFDGAPASRGGSATRTPIGTRPRLHPAAGAGTATS